MRILNYIAGELVAPASEQWLPNYEPATGLPYSEVPDSDEHDVERAVQAAHLAFPAWSRLDPSDRARFLRKLAQAISAHLPELARAESADTGKPLTLAQNMDIPRSSQNFEFFADAATQFATECHAGSTSLNYTLRAPLGVVACISPWNLPLYLLTWKLAPAFAAGNCVVAKPSEVTPMTAMLLSQICTRVGLPPGVLNIVHGLGPKVGTPLVRHPLVKAVSFTGSTATGSAIAATTAPLFKKVSLEMGGKNPTILFADCDRERAIQEAVRSAFTNQGQVCLCGSRIYIERSIYAETRDRILALVRELKQGDPLAPGVSQGAVVSQQHYDKVLGCIETAKREGGKILCGGNPARLPGRCEKGWFIEPTLIEGLDATCATNQEEIFGPVATLTPFDSEAEVLGYANSTTYGLAASLWTRDIGRAHRVAEALHSGIVWVNCWLVRDLRTPFGGVKSSGVGREGGWEALRFFTEPKNICVAIPEAP